MTRKYRNLAVLFLVLAGLGLRVWGSGWGLPYLYHPDEDKIVNHALAFGSGDLNPRYFGWPSLPMYVMFFIYGCYFIAGWLAGLFASPEQFLVAFAADPSDFYLLGRWLSALLGAFTVWLTYSAGRRLYGREVGLAGAFFLAVNYLHVKDSHYITPDVPVAFMVLAAFYFTVRIIRDPGRKNYVAAGILAGLAISVKYPAFVVALSLLAAHLIAVKTTNGVRLFSPRAWLGAGLVPLGFFAGTPYILLAWKDFLVDLQHQQIQVSRPLPMVERALTLFFDNPLPALGIGIYLCSLAGAARCLSRREPADILLLSFPLTYLAFLLVTGGLQHRYLMPVLPFFCLLAALFLVEMAHALLRLAIVPQRLGRPIMAAAAFGLALQPAAQSVTLALSLSQTDTRTQAKQWIEKNIPGGSRIALESYGPPLLSARTAASQRNQSSATVEDWQEHREKITERSVYGRLKSSRLGQQWKAYNSLVDTVRENAHQGRPRYLVFGLRPIPYPWRVRLETGQVSEDDVRARPEFKYFFEPEDFLRENNIEYVVLTSGTDTSEKMRAIVEQQTTLLHQVKRQPWLAHLPFYSFHNPAIEVYRLESAKAGSPARPAAG
jgi:hypothetical protein